MKTIISTLMLMISFQSLAQELTPQQLDQKRVEWIVKAFNQRPDSLIEPLESSDVKIRDGVGRVDVNKKAKFSYYIQTQNSSDLNSEILLIPMATSRFAPTYYQTDEWWDAHKNEKPMPRQPMEEVTKYLEEMKLTTNPDVLVLKPADGKVERKPLQDFLLDVYLKKYAKNGKITLYRGAERENETEQWEKGLRPSGVRYWTPTANYAWRYARKNLSFIEDLFNGQAPLLKFEMPVEAFKAMAQRRWPHLTLGTELTKRVHDGFDRTGRFQDQLTEGYDYLGEGTYGVEFEIRSNKAGADEMARYYKSTISIEELAQDRIKVIRNATLRLQEQRPAEKERLEAIADARIQTIQNEARILLLLKNKGSAQEIEALMAKLGSKREMTYIDGFYLQNFVREQLARGGFDKKFDIESLIQSSVQPLKSCRMVRL